MYRVSARSYSTASQSIKLLSRDAPGHLTTLSAIVNNSGSKAGKSGVSHLLSKYNFLNTEFKSALRFTRESELLGAKFSTNVTRDAIILNAQFLREDLPYFVEAFGNVLTRTSFRPHEFPETVLPAAKAEYESAIKSNKFVGLESLHELSFRRGLGQPLYYDGTNKITLDEVKEFASEVYNASNVNLVASGANKDDLLKFVGESSLSELSIGSSKQIPVELFQNKESRIRSSGESIAFIGIPIKKADFAKYEILSAAIGTSNLPGSSAPLSKIQGADSQLYKYQDAGLFVVSVSGEASSVATGIKAAKKVLDSVSASQLSAAIKPAKLSVALQSAFEFPHVINVDEASAKSAFKLSDFNYVAIGNTDVLPYVNEL